MRRSAEGEGYFLGVAGPSGPEIPYRRKADGGRFRPVCQSADLEVGKTRNARIGQHGIANKIKSKIRIKIGVGWGEVDRALFNC